MVKNNQLQNSKDSFIPARYVQCLLLFCGISVAFSMRVNMSVAVVAMTDSNSTNADFEEFKWDEKIKSYLLSSFFCGYICTQLPAGYLAMRFGGKTNLLWGILLSSLSTLLIPYGASLGNWQFIVVLRAIAGVGQGVLMPSVHTLLSKWAPTKERSLMGIYAYSGVQLGTATVFATSGVLASSRMGWPSIFYLPGIMGICWCLIWYMWGASQPSDCKIISITERKFIEDDLSHCVEHDDKKKFKFPLKKALTSVPFIVLIVTHCSFAYGFATLLTQIPNYMKNVLHLNIKSNALLSSLPYFAKLILGLALSEVSKLITKYKLMKLTIARKMFNTIGFWVPAILLVILGYVDAEHPVTATVLLTTMVALNASTYLGFIVNHIDLSPNFAGILLGITNFAANIHSIIAPLVVGQIVTEENTLSEWRLVFFITAGYLFLGNLLFICLGSFDVQPWNYAYHITATSAEDSLKMENQKTNSNVSLKENVENKRDTNV